MCPSSVTQANSTSKGLKSDTVSQGTAATNQSLAHAFFRNWSKGTTLHQAVMAQQVPSVVPLIVAMVDEGILTFAELRHGV